MNCSRYFITKEMLSFVSDELEATHGPATHALHYYTTKPLTLELSPASNPAVWGFKSPIPV
jgi:hypothetical protein